MRFVGKTLYSAENVPPKFLAAFAAQADGPFVANPREVRSIWFFSMEKIREMLRAGEKFHPETLFLLSRFFSARAI